MIMIEVNEKTSRKGYFVMEMKVLIIKEWG